MSTDFPTTELKAAKIATGIAGVMLGDACSEIDRLRAEVQRLSGCLLVISGAEGCGNGALRTAAYEAATMGRTVQDLQIRLGVPVPWVDLRSAVTVGSKT